MALPNTQARVGIARVGAARVGDAYPNIVILINGVDKSSAILRSSLKVRLARDDVPPSASFTIVSSSGFVPSMHQEVIIKHGGATLPLYGGQINDLEYVFAPDRQPTPWVNVTCGGWEQLADRRIVTDDLSGMSGTDAARWVVDRYMSGFNSSRIKSGMGTLGQFPVINEPPTSVLKRIATTLGGGSRIDASKYVYVWDVNGEDSRYLPSAPQTIAAGLWSVRQFRHGYNGTQVVTRAIAEGRSTRALTSAPAGATSLPIEYGWMFKPTLGEARVGGNALTFSFRHGVTGLHDRAAAGVTVAAAIGDTSITVGDTTALTGWDPIVPIRWLTDAAGNVFKGTIAGPTTINTIPAAGEYGYLSAPLAVGDGVYALDVLWGLAVNGVSGLVWPIENGEAVVVRHTENDAAAQAALAAIEGGDGVHEAPFSDPDLSYVGVEQLAQANLALFNDDIVRATWTTQDRNAVPGAQQAIAIGLTGGLTTTITIDRVTLTFPDQADTVYPLPLRQCEGASVKLRGWIDYIQSRVI